MRVGPLHIVHRHVDAVQEHVHHTQRPGRAVGFLSIGGVVLAADVLYAFDDQRAGTACRITKLFLRLWIEQFHQQHGDACRGVEFTGLLAGIAGKAFDQILVGIADDVGVADLRRAQIQPWIVEVFEQMAQTIIALLGASQRGFAVEVDIAENAVQLFFIGVFDLLQGHVDQFTHIVRGAAVVERVVVAFLGQHKAFVLQLAADAPLVVAVKPAQFLVAFTPHVADVFEKEHHQDVVLVLGGVNRATEGVAGFPQDAVDRFLFDCALGHVGYAF